MLARIIEQGRRWPSTRGYFTPADVVAIEQEAAALDVERHEPIIVGHCDVGVSLGCECGWREPDRPGDPSWLEHIAREYAKLTEGEG